MQTVLIVDDDFLIRSFLEESFKRMKKKALVARNGKEALDLLAEKTFDLVLTDMKMPGASGLEVLKKAKESNPAALVLIMTAFASVENAVEAMRLGAFNYLIKPFSLEVLQALLKKAEQHEALIQENFSLKQQIHSLQEPYVLDYKSPSMQKLFSDVKKIAKSQAHVFITGESGTGKEVLASSLHHLSPRKDSPFIRVNCAAIAENLLESEFFGHEKGAFTGALQRRLGRFELAHKGTLLLDEVTEIPLNLQAKLLRAVQEETFERVGSEKSQEVDVRIIATSNRDMKEAIEQKIFREDLYYRLNVVPLHIPPLRERKEDILSLANHFLKKFCQENHKELKEFSKKAEEKLLSYTWPGNVRELANLIERATVLSTEKVLSEKDFSLEENQEPCSQEAITLKELEERSILERLKKLDNHRENTAKSLGISPRTLRNKLQEYERKSLSQKSLLN